MGLTPDDLNSLVYKLEKKITPLQVYLNFAYNVYNLCSVASGI